MPLPFRQMAQPQQQAGQHAGASPLATTFRTDLVVGCIGSSRPNTWLGSARHAAKWWRSGRAPLRDIQINAGLEKQRAANWRRVATQDSAEPGRRSSPALRRCGFRERSALPRSTAKIDVRGDAALAADEAGAKIILEGQPR